ncbi:MAG: outer membrane protein assembly factor BamB [Pseudomonadales bacterium]|mgnify:CR=1 FL=1|jgi:outer membrane protein assembly factor BamB|nr:outer membrane protein assembly factor BamB [Pseudomonadales bacterium]
MNKQCIKTILQGGIKSIVAASLVTALTACSLLNDTKKEDVVAPLKELPSGAISLTKQWSRSVGSQGDDALLLALTPAVNGGTIYAANADGGVLAISRASGDVRWKVNVDTSLVGAVGAGVDLVFVSPANGGVIALDAASGTERWRAQTSSQVLAAVATDGDVVVAQSTDARAQAFDANTGRARWSYKASQAVLTLRGNSSPVIQSGSVFVAFDNGKIAVLNASTGLMQWERRFIVPDGRTELERIIDVQADPVLTSTDVIVASYQGAIVDIAQESGQIKWEQKASVVHSMATADDVIFLVEGKDTVRALSMTTGNEIWKADGLDNRGLSSPAVLGAYLAVADKRGYIHLLKRADGSYVGRYNIGGNGVRADLQSDGDTLYALTASGKLYALSIKS